MQPKIPIQPSSSKSKQTPFICKKCKQGSMLPAVEEGEPDYTDIYICEHCHFQDWIPAKDLIFGQFLTGISGIILCLCLLTKQLSILFKGIQNGDLNNAFSNAGLAVISAFFIAGFLYVLHKAQEGLKLRKSYANNKLDT